MKTKGLKYFTLLVKEADYMKVELFKFNLKEVLLKKK